MKITMYTMYELLGMVKDGKAPKKVRYNDEIYDTESSNNFSLMIYETIRKMCDDGEVQLFLNDEVEILEEEKKIPEKIKDKYCSQISKVELAQKYNEIIDYLDYLKSKGE